MAGWEIGFEPTIKDKREKKKREKEVEYYKPQTWLVMRSICKYTKSLPSNKVISKVSSHKD